ncbi:DUF3850 domain-containing protein [Vibrio fluvialis]|uniref:DUF3850 domain-containing protein n=1 Tax=Vibrio fluvialis TaxID=676 RepID=UPI0015998097|nr:DUF3850 domain-containing protein [Vibrio fluvialis]MBY8164456.1 DUF3850 domain-containing protein [Vibrio fluvialis]QKE35898.1 DUF3850 domain-containing protein [Vibrio fluvialis]
MSTLIIHELKISAENFTEVLAGRKTHEVRFNDRNYQIGDCLNLREIDESGHYTGQEMNTQISHVLHGDQYGLAEGWCVLSLKNTTHNKAQKLIEYLRDRLEETCDCIEAGYGIARSSGHSTSDAAMTVEGGRVFIEEANQFLNTFAESQPCNTPQ